MSMKAVKFEFKRMLHERNLKISLIISMIVIIMDIFEFYMQRVEFGDISNTKLIQAWIGTDYQFAFNSLFYILLPVIACLPYGGSLYQDRNSGYDKNLLINATRKQYLLAKAVVVYISAFAAVAIPLLLNLFISAGLYRNERPEPFTYMSVVGIDRNMFPVLLNEHPVIYCLIYIAIDGVFAGAMGLLSMAVTGFCRSAFTVIMCPFILYIVTGAMLISGDGTTSGLFEGLNPLQSYCITYQKLLIIYALMMFVATGFIWIFNRKRDVL